MQRKFPEENRNTSLSMHKQFPITLFSLSLILFLVLLPLFQQAQTLSGKILDDSGQPLPFATIHIKNSTQGSVSNEEGNYTIRLENGRYLLNVRYIGYKTTEFEVIIQGNTKRDFMLVPEEVTLEDVIITADGKDPAYSIIRKAIKNKDQNRVPYKRYGYETYAKTLVRADTEKDSTQKGGGSLGAILGMSKNDTVESMSDQILYLSENITQVWMLPPNQKKEKIISSQVSGEKGGFSLVGNAISRFLDFNPYDNIIPFEGVTERGILSPIANTALVMYDYKLLGTIQSGGYKYYKIKVIPKRKEDPVFSGLIYILDSTYGVKSVDLTVDKSARLIMFDTIRVQQDFVPLNDSVWVPMGMNYRMALQFNLMGMKMGLRALSEVVNSQYEVNASPPSDIKANEVIAFGDSATLRDSAYWDAIRPVPLKTDEKKDYFSKDSLSMIQNSPEYLDSLTKHSNKFQFFQFFLSGYTYRNYRKKWSFTLTSPLYTVGFNPMEGYYAGLRGEQNWELKKTRTYLKLTPEIRFGFSNLKFSYRMALQMRLRSKGWDRFTAEGGDYVNEFSPFQQIGAGTNYIYASWFTKNYLAYYRRVFGHLSYGREVLNGLRMTAELTWEDRHHMPNTYKGSKDRQWPPNLFIDRHQALIATIRFGLQLGNKYIRTPEGKINLGSKVPYLRRRYDRGIAGILGGDISYDKISGGISKDYRLGLAGTFAFDVSGGAFLSVDSLQPIDFQHFKGNLTIFREEGLRQFNTMNYYSYSTHQPWLEAHAEHSFGGFLLNKVPGIKKLKLSEYAGAHYLYSVERGHYLEGSFGLEARIIKRLVPIRVDFHYRFIGQFGTRWNITLTSIFGNNGSFQLGRR